MAQELLLAYGSYISRLSLIPGEKGRFEVTVDGDLVYSKAQTRRFPELAELLEKVAAKIK